MKGRRFENLKFSHHSSNSLPLKFWNCSSTVLDANSTNFLDLPTCMEQMLRGRTPRGPPPRVQHVHFSSNTRGEGQSHDKEKVKASIQPTQSMDSILIQMRNENQARRLEEEHKVKGKLWMTTDALQGLAKASEVFHAARLEQDACSDATKTETNYSLTQNAAPKMQKQDLSKNKSVAYRELLLQQIQQSAERKRISKLHGVLEQDVSFDETKVDLHNFPQVELVFQSTSPKGKDDFINRMIDHENERSAQRKAATVVCAQQLREQIEENHIRKLVDKQEPQNFIFETTSKEHSLSKSSPWQSPQFDNFGSPKAPDGKKTFSDRISVMAACESDRSAHRREERAVYDLQLRQQIEEKVKQDRTPRSHGLITPHAACDLFAGEEGNPGSPKNTNICLNRIGDGFVSCEDNKWMKQLEYRELLNEQIEENRKQHVKNICTNATKELLSSGRQENESFVSNRSGTNCHSNSSPAASFHEDKQLKQLEYLNMLRDQIKENARHKEAQRKAAIEEELRFELNYRELLDQQQGNKNTCASATRDRILIGMEGQDSSISNHSGVNCYSKNFSKARGHDDKRLKQLEYQNMLREQIKENSRQHEKQRKDDIEEERRLAAYQQNVRKMSEVASNQLEHDRNNRSTSAFGVGDSTAAEVANAFISQFTQPPKACEKPRPQCNTGEIISAPFNSESCTSSDFGNDGAAKHSHSHEARNICMSVKSPTISFIYQPYDAASPIFSLTGEITPPAVKDVGEQAMHGGRSPSSKSHVTTDLDETITRNIDGLQSLDSESALVDIRNDETTQLDRLPNTSDIFVPRQALDSNSELVSIRGQRRHYPTVRLDTINF